MYYDRGDLPIKMEYLTGGEKISWLADINKLDYSLYLPLFFDGLSETKHPYKTYARQGVRDLLNSGGDKIHAVIPQLIIPIKSRCNARNLFIIEDFSPYFQHTLHFRRIEHEKPRSNVRNAENTTTLGAIIGFGWSSSRPFLSSVVAHVQYVPRKKR